MQAIASLRCSSLPEVFVCAGAARPAEILIDPVNDAATDGVAAHEVMAVIAGNDLLSTRDVDIDGIAKRHGVDADDLQRMAWLGLKCWRELRDAFRGARAEVSLMTHVAGIELTGHIDLLGLYLDQGFARVLDWKGGRVDRDYAHQVFGYAVLVMLNHPEVERVDASIVWMREGEIEPYTVTRHDMQVWIDRLRAEVIAWDGVFRPGGHCVHCPRSHACEAVIALQRRDMAILGGEAVALAVSPTGPGLEAWDGPLIADVHRRAQTLKAFCESFHQLVRGEVIRRGGEIDAGDGKVLAIKSTQTREIDPLRSWQVLQSLLTDEELAACTKVRIGKVEDAVAAKAGKGKGAGAKRDLAAALEDVGAIVTSTSSTMREVRKK